MLEARRVESDADWRLLPGDVVKYGVVDVCQYRFKVR